MVVNLIDPLPEAVEGSKFGGEAVGNSTKLGNLLAPENGSELSYPFKSPRSALALHRLTQDEITVEEIVWRKRRRLIDHVMSFEGRYRLPR
jgi:hypothetical protein